MEEFGFVYILPITAYFSEGDELPSARSPTKRLDSIQSIAQISKRLLPIDCPLSKRLIRVSDQVIASQSNRLLYANYRFLSFISLIASLFISLLYLMMLSTILLACNTCVNKELRMIE